MFYRKMEYFTPETPEYIAFWKAEADSLAIIFYNMF
jgi:hypothetical protein